MEPRPDNMRSDVVAAAKAIEKDCREAVQSANSAAQAWFAVPQAAAPRMSFWNQAIGQTGIQALATGNLIAQSIPLFQQQAAIWAAVAKDWEGVAKERHTAAEAQAMIRAAAESRRGVSESKADHSKQAALAQTALRAIVEGKVGDGCSIMAATAMAAITSAAAFLWTIWP